MAVQHKARKWKTQELNPGRPPPTSVLSFATAHHFSNGNKRKLAVTQKMVIGC